MIFWSKTPQTKEGQLEARKFRDLKSLLHQQHAAAMDAADDEAYKSSGYQEAGAGVEDGIDEDLGSKVGRQQQVIKELMHERAKTIGSRRKSIRKRRSKARKRAKSLGFS